MKNKSKPAKMKTKVRQEAPGWLPEENALWAGGKGHHSPGINCQAMQQPVAQSC